MPLLSIEVSFLLSIARPGGPDLFTNSSLAPTSFWRREPDILASFGIASDATNVDDKLPNIHKFPPVFPHSFYALNTCISEETGAYVQLNMPVPAVETHPPAGATLSKRAQHDATDEGAKQRKKLQNRLYKRASST
jgi:hypothetical protein